MFTYYERNMAARVFVYFQYILKLNERIQNMNMHIVAKYHVTLRACAAGRRRGPRIQLRILPVSLPFLRQENHCKRLLPMLAKSNNNDQ